ncbi:Hypothetical DUF427-domain-containing protein [Mycena kentingensis (nom. inval.)]|nr:Hypothetical DUF427-domain-containing protein [Mycena kentingensis (nom. inval.)]
MQVLLNGTVIADAPDADLILVEGNDYFPSGAIKQQFFTPSRTSSVCPWKGTAAYYNAIVDGESVQDVAWYYPETYEKANHIKGRVAFYKNKVKFVKQKEEEANV